MSAAIDRTTPMEEDVRGPFQNKAVVTDAPPRTLEAELAELEAEASVKHSAFAGAVRQHHHLQFGETAELQQLRRSPFEYAAAVQAAERAITEARAAADAAQLAVSRHLQGWAARRGERPGPFARAEAEAARQRQERLAGDLRGLGVEVSHAS